MKVTPALVNWLKEAGYLVSVNVTDDVAGKAAIKAVGESKLTTEKYVELTNMNKSALVDPLAIFGGGQKTGFHVSSDYKAPATYKDGRPVMLPCGRPGALASQRELTKLGVMFRRSALKSGLDIRQMNAEENEIWNDMSNEDEWAGYTGGNSYFKGPGSHVKALIDDSGSGGQYLSPTFFDDAIVSSMLLNGELFPYIDLKEAAYGSDVQTAKVGNVSVTWGTAEGTAVSLFDTASLVSNITATVHNVMAAIEVGRDLLSDSPANVGAALEMQLSEKMKAEFDRVIAEGSGSGEPEGITVASGLTSVATAISGGPITVSDVESVFFALSKSYRRPELGLSWIASDTTWRRIKGVPTGADNAVRVFGTDNYSGYRLLDTPFRVCNDLANTTMAFGLLKKYRMWMRQGGFSFRWHTEGQNLAVKNTALLVGRARVAGKVVDTSAFVKTTTLAA